MAKEFSAIIGSEGADEFASLPVKLMDVILKAVLNFRLLSNKVDNSPAAVVISKEDEVT